MPGRRCNTSCMNRLSMEERKTIVGLLGLKWSERHIAAQTGHHRATTRRIALKAATEIAEPATVREVATDSPQSRSVCETNQRKCNALSTLREAAYPKIRLRPGSNPKSSFYAVEETVKGDSW